MLIDEKSHTENGFIDEYMRQMDLKVARQNVLLSEAFIPGDHEDIVSKSKNSRADLQDFLCKLLRKEKFYKVKATYLAKKSSESPSKKPRAGKGRSEILSSFGNGGVVINISINQVYIFHKTLKEASDFFTSMSTRIDGNPILGLLIKDIMSRETIKMSSSFVKNSPDSGDFNQYDQLARHLNSTDSQFKDEL